MNDHFVDYGKELLIANETQRNKIQFLQRERLKRDHYLSDLTENLSLNKQMLREYAQFGEHEATMAALNHENQFLSGRLREYYQQYQSINASLLMEQQMRLSDRQFYEERLVQFENKMADLRKYLHDKEDSFTSVVLRLKRYEDMSEPPIDDKLHPFRKEIAEKHINEFVAQLVKERNHYQRQYEAIAKHSAALAQLKILLQQQYPQAAALIEQFEDQRQVTLSALAHPHRPEEEKKISKKSQPNAQLIRLLKKEKLNNQLLEGALSDAIDKNEELVATNDLLQKSIDHLNSQCRLLRAENAIFALRLAEYDQHYCRVATHRRRYYQEGEPMGLREISEERLREYGQAVEHFFGSSQKLGKNFSDKLREDVERWGRMICDAREVKQNRDKQQILVKSCSMPRLIVDFQLDEEGEELMIEQF